MSRSTINMDLLHLYNDMRYEVMQALPDFTPELNESMSKILKATYILLKKKMEDDKLVDHSNKVIKMFHDLLMEIQISEIWELAPLYIELVKGLKNYTIEMELYEISYNLHYLEISLVEYVNTFKLHFKKYIIVDEEG